MRPSALRRAKARRTPSSLVALLLVAVSLFSLPVRAQQPRRATDVYAITNSRLVTVSGGTIERGTIVVRDGLIAAVGANVAVPPDARIIDGANLTVYPGVIDANTSLGIPAPTATPQVAGRGAAAFLQAQPAQPALGSAPNTTQPPGLNPEINAADLIRPGGDQIDAAHNAGIAAALTAPREGILIGQSAFINLAGDTPQQMIVSSPVALHVGFTPLRTGGYPGSLMGVITTIRQSLMDARRYAEANAVYEKNPRGLRRPEQDRMLAALVPVINRQIPVVMYAEREREINRALDIAQEFNLRAIIAGGLEAWKVADRLKRTNTPVLLSLNFPRRTTAANPDADPEPLRILRERVEAPKNAARLAQAGVVFAFQSGGMANMNDYLANAARTVENGLSRDEAVAALTLRPAQIFNIADRLGTLEAGKIANLTVTRGDIFDNRARRIAYVFVDGRPVDLRPVAAPAAGGVNATGTWNLKVTLDVNRESNATLTLQQEGGERLRGSIAGDFGSAQISNASIGASGDIKFTATLQVGGVTTDAIFNGTVTGNQMSGTVQVVGRANGTFTGTRAGGAPQTGNAPQGRAPNNAQMQPNAPSGQTQSQTSTEDATASVAGTWSITIDIPGQPLASTLNLQQQGESLTGSLVNQLGTTPISSGSVQGNSFTFSATVSYGGQSFEITASGSVNGNSISGTIASPQGNVPFSGSRTPQK